MVLEGKFRNESIQDCYRWKNEMETINKSSCLLLITSLYFYVEYIFITVRFELRSFIVRDITHVG